MQGLLPSNPVQHVQQHLVESTEKMSANLASLLVSRVHVFVHSVESQEKSKEQAGK
jgi:hypothetical protein